MRIVMIGLSITSAWGNGPASHYRSLARALARRGHAILFLERNVPWYAEHRDAPQVPYAQVTLYDDLAGLDLFRDDIAAADLVMVGSYVPDGPQVIDRVLEWSGGVRAFY